MAPCVDVLRQLSKNFNDNLGADQGTRHAPVNLTDDIQSLMESLEENNVYRLQNGRELDEDDGPVKDVMALGLQNLVEGNKNPLSDYNEAFQRLQRRRKMAPVNPKSATSHESTTTIPKKNNEVSIQSIQEHTNDTMQEVAGENTWLIGDDEGMEDELTETPSLDPFEDCGESHFAPLGADDVELDMDSIEGGYMTSDEAEDESDDDLDESDVETLQN